jgi:hypothetical protein
MKGSGREGGKRGGGELAECEAGWRPSETSSECAGGLPHLNAPKAPGLLDLLAVSALVGAEYGSCGLSSPSAAGQQNAVECRLSAWELGVVEAALAKGDEALLLEAAAILLHDTGPAALTVKQPWARALSWGVKDVENRCYQLRLPASGGKWLALHAGASTDLLSNNQLYSKLSAESGISVETWQEGIGDEKGVLLGAMLISNVSETLNKADAGPWAIRGMYSWKVQKVVRLPRPLAISGALGTWALPPALRLLLALHIRRGQDTGQESPGSLGQEHEEGQQDAQQYSESACKVSESAWHRLHELVCVALQYRLQLEQEAERRRRDKAQRFRSARSYLGPGVHVEVHQMWLHAGGERHQDGGDGGSGEGAAKRHSRIIAAVGRTRGSRSKWFCVKLLRHQAKDKFLGQIVSEVRNRAPEPLQDRGVEAGAGDYDGGGEGKGKGGGGGDVRICARDGRLVRVSLPRDASPDDAHTTSSVLAQGEGGEDHIAFQAAGGGVVRPETLTSTSTHTSSMTATPTSRIICGTLAPLNVEHQPLNEEHLIRMTVEVEFTCGAFSKAWRLPAPLCDQCQDEPLNDEHLPLNGEHLPLNEDHLPLNVEHQPLNEEHLPLNKKGKSPGMKFWRVLYLVILHSKCTRVLTFENTKMTPESRHQCSHTRPHGELGTSRTRSNSEKSSTWRSCFAHLLGY